MPHFTPAHAAIKAYFAKQKAIASQGVTHELAVREAFKDLLSAAASANHWTLVVEQKVEGLGRTVRPDGTLRDGSTLPRGYWEAKDTHDNLDAEIGQKIARGYPTSNIVFEDTRRAVLFQAGTRAGEFDLTQPEQIATLLTRLLSYVEPNITSFEQAVERFKLDTPELAKGLLRLIDEAHRKNRKFQTAFQGFFDLCQQALNPNLSQAAVNEMLIQHLLTERLMRTIFDNPDFARRNVIAREVERVIDALTSQSFSRTQFLGQLDYFYAAIEAAARPLRGFGEKQHFINTVYERFFQGYAVKVADTHGIVYTPQPLVDFMGAAVEEVLHAEFGLRLGDEGVAIIDPCTGTGNFVINLLQRIQRRNPLMLEAAYRERLFANEVMLLPYYVASLNIEHAYMELTGQYESFEGLCFVDTLALAEGPQLEMGFLTAANSERVQRQKEAPITVVIGNPPYNVGQLNENDNNKNRKYGVIDKRVQETYSKASKATNKNALSDPYVKFFRWASDRLQGRDGVVCFVSNSGFIEGIAFDGFRKHVYDDFNRIYVLDLKGNVRKDSMRDGIPIGEEHTVFGLSAMVGISITVLVRNKQHLDRQLLYHEVNWRAKRVVKFALLNNAKSLGGIDWRRLTPDAQNSWLVAGNADEYTAFLSIGNKEAKAKQVGAENSIFEVYSSGVKTNRDETVYDFVQQKLISSIQGLADEYNSEVDRYKRNGHPKDVDSFVNYARIKWSESLKANLSRGVYAQYDVDKIRTAVYRPYTKQYLYFDSLLNERRYLFPEIFPSSTSENQVIWIKVGSDWPMFALAANSIVDLLPQGGSQCFPFYTYNEDGSHRRENITDWALAHFQQHYAAQPCAGSEPAQGSALTKWDIFHYVYALLHHPVYRSRYADNLKRELPRIPLAPDFWGFATAGRKLADLHLHYETVQPYGLEFQWAAGQPINWRVTKLKLSADKTALRVNETLTLADIPPEVFSYRLGNRSALEWIIDQYQVSTDAHSGSTSDPNGYSDNPRYIVELVCRVVNVSVQTVALVQSLPDWGVVNDRG